jgi:hypothetical protein
MTNSFYENKKIYREKSCVGVPFVNHAETAQKHDMNE